MNAPAPHSRWPGIIEAYRDRLPVTDATPIVTLHEGGTPLVDAPRLSDRTGARVRRKVEGANPTGSFKDRGMTVAISKAAEEGAKVVAISDSSVSLHNANGVDVQAAFVHKAEHGTLRGLANAEEITQDELVTLDVDILAPCALEQVVTEQNADRVKASIICEGANGPVTPAADAILEDKGVLILPDVLANAGGVVVSYFEWVQGLQEYFWKETEVNAKLNDIVSRAFEETWETSLSRSIPMRMAAYGLAVQRVAEATITRGIYP